MFPNILPTVRCWCRKPSWTDYLEQCKYVWAPSLLHKGSSSWTLLVYSLFIIESTVLSIWHFIVYLLIYCGLVQGSDECYLTKAHCSRGGGEALSKGIIVETTDLRLRSLVMEKDSKVAVVELNICVSCFWINSVFQTRLSLHCDIAWAIYWVH